MTSSLRKVRQRLQLTTTVLLHGPGALPRRRWQSRSTPTGPVARRRVVEQEQASPPSATGRHAVFVDAGVAAPRTARERFDHALSTDLGPWQQLGQPSIVADKPLTLPSQVDIWAAVDPLLGLANGFYRARLIEPATPTDQIVAAALSGTPMFATSATVAALAEEVRDLVTGVADVGELRGHLLPLLFQDELFDRASLQLRRRATRRFAGTSGVEHRVSAVVPTNRPHRIASVIENVGRQTHPVELVLVLHGLGLDEGGIREQAQAAGVGLTIVTADASLTLGACMNLGVEAATGRYIAKMDDDNHYAPEFLGDLVDAAACSGADIVGKWAHFVWLRSTDAVVLRYPDSELQPERRVQGGAMLFSEDVVRTLQFSDIPRAVDTDILDRALEQGYRVYSADRFNYVSVRGTDATQHTWQVGDESFLTRKGTLVFFGDPTEHVTV